MALIKTETLRHTYRSGSRHVCAVDGVTLTIQSGEFVAIMGPSGSGKSTFLHLLGCLDTPTSGRYWLDGIDISGLSRNQLASLRNRSIGFIFQAFNLLPRTSALENVEVPLLYRRVRSAERRKRALALLDELGLSGRTEHTAAELSGGEQQRVAIARALVNEPMVLLADEPTGALDSQTGREIMDTFRHLNRQHGLTIVLVTHEAEVAGHADRIVTFCDGRVISDHRGLPILSAMPRAGFEAVVCSSPA